MVNNTFLKYFSVVLFVVLIFLYYFIAFFTQEIDKVFLTIATFLFAIFAGFFISRQGSRYSSIREKIATFDGNMSTIYRVSGHLGTDAQAQVGEIIKAHYQKILEAKAWDYHFTHKSSTLTSLHGIMEKTVGGKALVSLQNMALAQIFGSLRDAQLVRKNMVALYQERIPRFQWVLISFLAVILLLVLLSIPSYHALFNSLLKSAFTYAIIVVVILLYQLDRLQFFEGTIGETSAQDVVSIIDGKK